MVESVGSYRGCSTSRVRQLDLQLIAQANKIVPGILTSFAHLNISIGGGVHPYLQAPAVKALEKAVAARDTRMICNSAYRTIAQQFILYSHYRNGRCGITAAALPGRSNHNSGLALDTEDALGWKPYLERFGWDWLGSWDFPHHDFVGGGTRNLGSISILAFQQLWNLNHPTKRISEDGKWGMATANALASTSVDGFARGDRMADKSRPIRSLRMGDIGNDVKTLQQALVANKYNVIVDGEFGEIIRVAVSKYQKDNGLVADGVAGFSTKKGLGI